MVLLKDLRAEVSHIQETIQKPTPELSQCSPPNRESESLSSPFPVYAPPQQPTFKTEHYGMHFYQQRPQAMVQEYRPPYGHARGTAQFQQRFAPQRYYSAPRQRPSCAACIQIGEQYCQHCFRCGSGEHFQAGCRAQRPTRPARESPLN